MIKCRAQLIINFILFLIKKDCEQTKKFEFYLHISPPWCYSSLSSIVEKRNQAPESFTKSLNNWFVKYNIPFLRDYEMHDINIQDYSSVYF